MLFSFFVAFLFVFDFKCLLSLLCHFVLVCLSVSLLFSGVLLLFFFFFWIILVDCCAALFFYISTARSSPVFQMGCTTGKRVLRMVATQRNAPRTV